MGYTHIEIETAQIAKHPQIPCGDVIYTQRTAAQTIVILSDGIGSGAKANLAANHCIARLAKLLDNGFSLRQAFNSVVQTMEEQRRRGDIYPYAVFTIAQIRNQGGTTILSYEMPPPIVMSGHQAEILRMRTTTVGSAILGEVNYILAPGEALLLVSDGITQAGIGKRFIEGWSAKGLREFVSQQLRQGCPLTELPKRIQRQALHYWQEAGDDCTALLMHCRQGLTVNLFTGPPADKRQDSLIAQRFLKLEGIKIIAGGSTAGVLARFLEKPVVVDDADTPAYTPVQYQLDGIDLVTEGAVTLSQVYNIFDEDPACLNDKSGVAKLTTLLHLADRVTIIHGVAANAAAGDITFRQQGILSREKILPLLVDKLRQAGKLVIVEHV